MVRSSLAPLTPQGTPPLPARPLPAGLLLDYAFHHTAVAVVQVMRFPWEVVLTAPHTVQVHWVADLEAPTPAAAVPVLAVHAQGPYVAVWLPDPGVLLEPAAAQRVFRLQLTLPLASCRARQMAGRWMARPMRSWYRRSMWRKTLSSWTC